MNLWMILYTMHGVGGTWGPLPYDMAECERRAAERQADVQITLDTGVSKGKAVPEVVLDELKHWRVACEWHDERPNLASEG
jgi:hypothetical protein